MKRLEITNFSKRVMDIYSDYFEVKYCSSEGNRYLIGLDVRDVVSYKPLRSTHYKMAIDKMGRGDGSYHVWLWDMEANVSYPMSLPLDEVSSLSLFTGFLNNTLKVATDGNFSGSKGNMIK